MVFSPLIADTATFALNAGLWFLRGGLAIVFPSLAASCRRCPDNPLIPAVQISAASSRTLEDAALDLGATRVQAFRRITLPFLKPTIVTAAVIAFLQSFEANNTTIFSIGGDHTLVTEIRARMRCGISPTLSAIGSLFVAVTVICAIVWGMLRQRERSREAAA